MYNLGANLEGIQAVWNEPTDTVNDQKDKDNMDISTDISK